ncbi:MULTISPECIES: LCP family protein [Brachybacterium]|uniref:Transcriptional regulator n=2 Tax=Brachybacterium conglomeratum TaxID=47846 RepID=A0ABQ5RJT4_9MICO|nr:MULTISPECIES: LCP family protein [Brachybacterium]GLI32133.1 transcriptional regulator [Brachybacterium conglomeratum]GLK03667.1 transcriptional regulator [Brachybacterium conglomeratum]
MTDPFSAPRRSRRRSGRHRQQPVRRTESTPLPKEQARRNRDAAFGAPNPKRTWIDTPAAPASAPSAPEAPADERTADARPADARPSDTVPVGTGRADARPADPRETDARTDEARPAEAPAPRATTPTSSSRTVRGARSASRASAASSTGSLPHTAERRSFPGATPRSDEPAAAASATNGTAPSPSGAEQTGASAPRGPERAVPRRPRGRRAAFPLEQLETSADGGPGESAPSPSPRGRRAAGVPTPADEATPASAAPSGSGPAAAAAGTAAAAGASAAGSASSSPQDAWTTSDQTPAPAEAPLAPDHEVAPVVPSPAEPEDDAEHASPHDEENALAHDRTARGTDEPGSSPASAAPAGDHDAPRDEDREGVRDRPVAVAAAALGAGAGVSAAASSGAAASGAASTGDAGGASLQGAGDGAGRGGEASGGGRSGSGGSGDSRSGGDRPSSDDGSLAKVAGWTVLTSALPGSGLVTTRMRQIGVIMLAVLLLAVATIAAVLVIGDPLRIAATLGTHRGVLIGALLVVVVVGLVWCLQIVLANLAQTTKERLEGAKRYLALALAAVMVIAVAVPFGRGVQSLWALQGLFGSTSVFGGDGDGLAEGPDPWADTPRLNIMLLGQDAGADRTGTRPDTLMVASIDTKTGQTALFSIPRNLENVEFPEGTVAAEEFPDGFDYYGKNENLINAVWAWAEENKDLFPGDPEPGLTATRWAVEETLGISTDYYAMVNLKGFEDLVNALGGVDLVVERRIPIGGGASEVEGYIEPGEQKLDGYHALWYARSREGSDDFNRMCRQQRIVRAVSEEADPTSLALSIPRLVTATEENIQTDIPVGNVDAFVELALRIKDGGFTSYPITQDVTFSGNPDWEYLEEWTDASIKDSMKNDPPESVEGETEPGSTEPAETGAPPEEDTATTEEPTAEATTTEEETTTEESTTEEESSSATTSAPTEEATPTDAPEIEQDPLKSCLPGAEG